MKIIFGLLLCIAMVVVWVYFFSPKRKTKVEKPKYDMLKEGDNK